MGGNTAELHENARVKKYRSKWEKPDLCKSVK